MNKAAHAANYARDSVQKSLSAAELHRELGEIIAAGHGDRRVFLMVTRQRAQEFGALADGLTHAVPLRDCFAADPDADGDIVWVI